MRDALLQSFDWVLAASWQSALIAIAIGVVQQMIGRKLSPAFRAAIWSLVLIRLALPVLPSSRFSLFNLVQPSAHIPAAPVVDGVKPTITFGVISDSESRQSNAIAQPPFLHATIVASRGFDIRLALACAWLIVAAAFLAKLLVGNLRFRRLLRSIPSCEDPRLLSLLESCRAQLDAPAVRLIETTFVGGPALAGIVRPVLLMPVGLGARLGEDELRFIFCHELVHVQRRDLAINWMLALIVVAHWFNPISWLIARRIRSERELACDQAVLSRSSQSQRIAYGQTILRMFDEFSRAPAPLLTAGMIDLHGSLRTRIAAIAEPVKPSLVFTLIGLICLTVIGCTTLTSARHPTTETARSDTASSNDLVTRVYDVRDLLVDIPSFNNAPDFNIPSTQPSHLPSISSTNKPTQQDLMNQLIRQIQSDVDPSSWQAIGLGTIHEAGDHAKLVVTQTQPNQLLVWQLLQKMRAQRGVQISVQSRFIQDKGQFADMVKSIGGTWNTCITDQQRDQLMQGVQNNPYSSTITAPRVTLFNGQRAYVLIATDQAYVKDIHAIHSTTRPIETAYEPEIGTVQSGVRLDMQALASADHKYVTLTLKPQLSNLMSMEHDSLAGRITVVRRMTGDSDPAHENRDAGHDDFGSGWRDGALSPAMS